jgi:hypothetical protein
MVLCDGIHRDAATGKFTLLGTFSTLLAQEFPAKAHFFVYSAVTDGLGKMPVRLRIVDAGCGIAQSEEAGRNVAEEEVNVEFPDPLAVHELSIEVHASLPKPGLYHCELLVNRCLLMSRRMLVVSSQDREGGSDE